MSTTPNAIRRAVYELLGDTVVGKADALGTTTSFLDTVNLQDSSLDNDFYKGWSLVFTTRVDPTRWRRVLTSVAATGALTWTQALGSAVAAAEPYELSSAEWSPPRVEQQIQTTLRQIRTAERTLVDFAGGRNLALSPSTFTWLRGPEDILGLLQLSGTAPNVDETSLEGSWLSETGGAYTINLPLGWSFGSADQVYLVTLRDIASYAGAVFDLTDVLPIDLDWAAHEVALDLLKLRLATCDPQDVARYQRQYNLLFVDTLPMRHAYGPERSRSLWASQADTATFGPYGRGRA